MPNERLAIVPGVAAAVDLRARDNNPSRHAETIQLRSRRWAYAKTSAGECNRYSYFLEPLALQDRADRICDFVGGFLAIGNEQDLCRWVVC